MKQQQQQQPTTTTTHITRCHLAPAMSQYITHSLFPAPAARRFFRDLIAFTRKSFVQIITTVLSAAVSETHLGKWIEYALETLQLSKAALT